MIGLMQMLRESRMQQMSALIRLWFVILPAAASICLIVGYFQEIYWDLKIPRRFMTLKVDRGALTFIASNGEVLPLRGNGRDSEGELIAFRIYQGVLSQDAQVRAFMGGHQDSPEFADQLAELRASGMAHYRSVATIVVGGSDELASVLGISMHITWAKPFSIRMRLPGWLLLPFLIGASALQIVHYRLKRAKHTATACTVCNYDLTGNESGICPECGSAVLKEDSRPRISARAWLKRIVVGVALSAPVLAAFGVLLRCHGLPTSFTLGQGAERAAFVLGQGQLLIVTGEWAGPSRWMAKGLIGGVILGMQPSDAERAETLLALEPRDVPLRWWNLYVTRVRIWRHIDRQAVFRRVLIGRLAVLSILPAVVFTIWAVIRRRRMRIRRTCARDLAAATSSTATSAAGARSAANP
ncbi:MAG: hypothetical protein V3T70_06615 [Phycisphaerae bacterium]